MVKLESGHDAALGDLMGRHAEKLFNYLLRQLQNDGDAADLAQEAFVRVYQNRNKFDPGQKFSTWLYTIATNLCRDRLRWRSRHPQVSLDAENTESGATLLQHLPDAQPAPDEEMQSAERAKLVRSAVAQLPDELRIPLILFEYEDRPRAEIAEILDCSVKAVEMRLYRARHLLREKLTAVLPTI